MQKLHAIVAQVVFSCYCLPVNQHERKKLARRIWELVQEVDDLNWSGPDKRKWVIDALSDEDQGKGACAAFWQKVGVVFLMIGIEVAVTALKGSR